MIRHLCLFKGPRKPGLKLHFCGWPLAENTRMVLGTRLDREGRASTTMNVQHEVKLLVEEIKRLGSDKDGKISVKFGVLFNDDRCANIFEALVGTLKAAKKKKIVHYDGELLLQGVHDNVDVVLLKDAEE